MTLNSLDLPSLALEKIFMNLGKDANRNLSNLTECCKYLKEFIETCPRLRNRLYMYLDIGGEEDCTSFVQYRSNLTAMMASTRRYREIKLKISNVARFEEIEYNYLNFKELFDKHASTVTSINIMMFCEGNSRFILKVLGFLANMRNLEKIKFLTCGEDELLEESYYDDAVVFPDNHFEKLKHLQIDTNVAGSWFIKPFQPCRNIKSLDLKFSCAFKIDYLFPIFKNCRESLTDLQFWACSCDYTKYLKLMKTVGLNLEKIDFRFTDMPSEDLLLFLEFMQAQKN